MNTPAPRPPIAHTHTRAPQHTLTSTAKEALMTADNFTEAAREESMVANGMEQWDQECFMEGAEWARAYLAAQEPTDAEVEAVASSILLSTTGRHWEDIDEGERREYRRYARAALSAARAARRDEEKR